MKTAGAVLAVVLWLASPALPVTKENLLDAWQIVYHSPPTEKIAKSMN